ncbi:hypothetical protein ABIB38_004662 [Massilia sp. UYP11]|uniref:hypothetical protein n=1 Tax=Massilia sp. UYP11 TaxID=1756385 RepID=UPI003D1CCF49
MKKQQSFAGVIRQRLADIEARLEVGIRQEVIIGELKEEGYETSLANFRNELWRARKWRDRRETVASSTPPPVARSASSGAAPAAQQTLDCAIQNAQDEGKKSDELDDLPAMEKYRQATNPEAVEKKFETYSTKAKRVNPLK